MHESNLQKVQLNEVCKLILIKFNIYEVVCLENKLSFVVSSVAKKRRYLVVFIPQIHELKSHLPIRVLLIT